MEALVHDLTLALEESNNNMHLRHHWNIRRRTHSAGNIPSFTVSKISEDSSSSMCEIHFKKRVEMSSMTLKCHSDSDDNNYNNRFTQFSTINNMNNIESDSVNENFIPRNITRRKRKCKKMSVDSDYSPATSTAMANIVTTNDKKKQFFRNNCDNNQDIWCGKRKRSYRERSTDCEMQSTKLIRNTRINNKDKSSDDNAMDCSYMSSSSISSSDSEGIITNEEDREGDDEQSDWIGDSNWWDDSENKNEDKLPFNTAFQSLMHLNIEHFNEESKRNNKQKIQCIRDGLNGREILTGRRHVNNIPGYSIITSVNEKVSRFLQDSNQTKLKLYPMRQFEREKLRRLAYLYNLNLKGDLTCPVLCKTKYTTQTICVDTVSLRKLSDQKRLRKPLNSKRAIENLLYNNAKIDQLSNTKYFKKYNTLENWEINKIFTDLPIKFKIHSLNHSKSN